MTRSRRHVALIVACALAATGCSTDASPSSSATAPTAPAGQRTSASPDPTVERAGGSLRFGLSGDPRTIDPRFVADDEGMVVVDALFDSLVALDVELGVVPAAASSWDVDDEGRRFTFTLREDATFHDGSPVTADDFVRTFNRIADGQARPASTLAYYLEPIEGFTESQATGAPLRGLRAPDPGTLEITLTEPFPEFLQVLARPELGPVPPVAEEAGDEFADLPIGNGPFAMAEAWQRNQFIRVQRFDGFTGDPPRLDEVVFRIYANDPAQEIQYAEFASGQLQFAEVPASKRDEAIEQFGLSTDGYTGPGVLDGLSTALYYYGFNLQQPPFDDPELRRAVSLSIDRQRIAREIARDTRVPAAAIVPPSVPGSQAAPCGHCRYAPEEARGIVDAAREAGLETESFTIVHDSGTTHAAIAERIAEDVRNATGLTVEVVARPLNQLVRELRAGEMEVFRLGWQAGYPSPGSYLLPLFSSGAPDNLTGYAAPEVDELLETARRSADDVERDRLYREAETQILADVPIAPILFYRHDKVVAPGVRGLVYTPMGTVDLARVWLEGP